MAYTEKCRGCMNENKCDYIICRIEEAKEIRNKAIDELTEEAMKQFTELELKDSLATATDFKIILRDVAEQMKGGAT